jgi:hypothetical protein
MREWVGLVAGYAKRLSRHFSASAIVLVPVAFALYATSSAIADAVTFTLFFGSFAVLSVRACWRARKPELVAEPDGCLVITNQWRTYRLRAEEVEGYTWTPPSWTTRDSEPIIAIVGSSGGTGRRLVRITTMSGDESWELVRALGLREVDHAA